MSFAMGLGASLRALSAARLGIQTASQNIANVNTPGYSRQRMLLSSSQPYTLGGFQVGSGVQVADVRRLVDEGLISRVAHQESVLGGARVRYERMREIEDLFANGAGGVAERMSELFGAVGALQSDPSDGALRGGVLQAGEAFTSGLNLVGKRLGALGQDVFREVQGLTSAVSSMATQVADLNAEIVRMEANGSTANDLRDRRDQAIRDLSGLVDVRRVDHASGSTDLIVGGRLLVAGRRADTLQVARDSSGNTQVTIGSNRRPARIEGGRIGALLELEQSAGPAYLARLDRLTRETVLGFDRIHTTGVPGNGPFQSLTAGYGAVDTNGNGALGDELLQDLGLPFAIGSGELFVRVTDRNSGDATHQRIAIDPSSTTLQELASDLSAIEHLQASVDTAGRLRISADQGFGFDFAPALDQRPDPLGLFGGAAPGAATAAGGPFDLNTAGFPQTFTVDVDGTVEVVTLDAADFANPSMATADEVAAAIEADLTHAEALVDADGRIVVRSGSTDDGSSLTLADGAGSPLAALGLPPGTFEGQSFPVEVKIHGEYTGDANQRLRFVAAGDGEIGITPGLQVHVLDEYDRRIATLDVGDGYDGTELTVADGVRVSFSQGSISASANDAFGLDTIADSDTADVLVGLGLNTFFLGATAESVRVNPDLVADPGRFAAARFGGSGGTGNLLRFQALQDRPTEGLGGLDLTGYVGALIADVGFESGRAAATLDTQENLGAFLEEQRLSISGVDLDEEMLDLVAWQQAFEAASRLVSVVQEMTDTLLELGR